MTNFVETDQLRGKCAEDYKKVNCTCNHNSDCTMGKTLTLYLIVKGFKLYHNNF